jgi:hypothetical protein
MPVNTMRPNLVTSGATCQVEPQRVPMRVVQYIDILGVSRDVLGLVL